MIVSAAGNLEHARVRELIEKAFGALAATGERSSTAAAAGRAAGDHAHQGARAEPCLSWHRQLSAAARRSVRQLHPEHGARRLDELAAVPEHPREARARLFGVQRPERLPRCRQPDDLRRLRERGGRRGRRSVRRRAASDEAGAGARRRAAAREGSPEGQPDAEPGEHRQPHVAPRAPGDLLRPAFRSRRNAGRRRTGQRPRTSSGWPRNCSRTGRSPRRSSDLPHRSCRAPGWT